MGGILSLIKHFQDRKRSDERFKIEQRRLELAEREFLIQQRRLDEEIEDNRLARLTAQRDSLQALMTDLPDDDAIAPLQERFDDVARELAGLEQNKARREFDEKMRKQEGGAAQFPEAPPTTTTQEQPFFPTGPMRRGIRPTPAPTSPVEGMAPEDLLPDETAEAPVTQGRTQEDREAEARRRTAERQTGTLRDELVDEIAEKYTGQLVRFDENPAGGGVMVIKGDNPQMALQVQNDLDQIMNRRGVTIPITVTTEADLTRSRTGELAAERQLGEEFERSELEVIQNAFPFDITGVTDVRFVGQPQQVGETKTGTPIFRNVQVPVPGSGEEGIDQDTIRTNVTSAHDLADGLRRIHELYAADPDKADLAADLVMRKFEPIVRELAELDPSFVQLGDTAVINPFAREVDEVQVQGIKEAVSMVELFRQQVPTAERTRGVQVRSALPSEAAELFTQEIAGDLAETVKAVEGTAATGFGAVGIESLRDRSLASSSRLLTILNEEIGETGDLDAETSIRLARAFETMAGPMARGGVTRGQVNQIIAEQIRSIVRRFHAAVPPEARQSILDQLKNKPAPGRSPPGREQFPAISGFRRG